MKNRSVEGILTGLDFARALRSLLRQDPDVILIGEVRDDILQAGGRLAHQIGPTVERRRSVLAMTDTPRALVTDLGAALGQHHVHIGATDHVPQGTL